MKTLFVGCLEISRPMIDNLLFHGVDIVGLLTIPKDHNPKPSGYSDISDLAEYYNIPLCETKRLHSQLDFIKEANADLMVVYGWNRIIKKEVLDAVPKVIGFHASLLPKYRGSAPVNWAIINGETETGITLFELDEDVDSGPILGQKAFPITLEDTCATVYEKSCAAACALISEKISEFKENIFSALPNVSGQFPVSPRRRPGDGLVDWSKTVKQNYDWIRALTRPYPGAFTILNGKKIILWNGIMNGEGEGLKFQCSDGYLLITDYEYDNSNIGI